MKSNNERRLIEKLEKVKGKFYCTHKGAYDGRKVSTVWLEIEGKVYAGSAACSHKDVYIKRVGRIKAFGRAMSNFEKGKSIPALPDFLKNEGGNQNGKRERASGKGS